MSLSSRSRKSASPVRAAASRSMPKPQAKPVYFSASMPTACENGRVDHPAAAELDPARPRAGAATGTAAHPARDVELGRGLGKGEETGPEPGMAPGPKKAPVKALQYPGQVAHAYALVHHERLDLMEDGQVAGVGGVPAVTAAGDHGINRGRPRFHEAHLHRRGMGAQQYALGLARLQVEGVEHASRRVVRRHVESLEIVPVVLHLGAFGDLETHGDEDVLQFVADLGHEMGMAPGDGRAQALGQRPVAGGEKPGGFAQVEPLGTGLAGRLLGRQLGAAAVVELLELGPGLLEGLAQTAPVVRLEVPQRSGDGRKPAFFPEGLSFHGPQLGQRRRPGDQRLAAFEGRRDAVHIPDSLPVPPSSCRGIPWRLWRAASKHRTAATMPTLSDSAPAAIGMLTTPSRCGRSSARSPGRRPRCRARGPWAG